MMALMVVFFLGYVFYLGFSYHELYSNFVASLLFFFTAFFIMLVIQLNHSFIISLTMKSLELKHFSEKLLNETESLSSSKQQLERIKALLEQKNQEQEAVLKKWSAWRIALAKSLAKKQAEQERAAQGQAKQENKSAEQGDEKQEEKNLEEVNKESS